MVATRNCQRAGGNDEMTELDDDIPEEDASNDEAPPSGMNFAINCEMNARVAEMQSRVLRGRKCFCAYIKRHPQPEPRNERNAC